MRWHHCLILLPTYMYTPQLHAVVGYSMKWSIMAVSTDVSYSWVLASPSRQWRTRILDQGAWTCNRFRWSAKECDRENNHLLMRDFHFQVRRPRSCGRRRRRRRRHWRGRWASFSFCLPVDLFPQVGYTRGRFSFNLNRCVVTFMVTSTLWTRHTNR